MDELGEEAEQRTALLLRDGVRPVAVQALLRLGRAEACCARIDLPQRVLNREFLEIDRCIQAVTSQLFFYPASGITIPVSQKYGLAGSGGARVHVDSRRDGPQEVRILRDARSIYDAKEDAVR